jgi:hypothetical protein
MSKKSIFARMFESFAKDAEPDEVLEAAKAVDAAECGKAKDEDPTEKKEPTYDESMEMVMDAIHELNEKIEAMQSENAAHHEEEAKDEEPEEEKLTGLDAVEAAIKERMSKDSDMGEEEVEVDPEEINAEDEEPEEEESEEAEVIEAEETDDEESEEVVEAKQAADAAISMAMLRAIKPIVASMPPRQRKRATDALNRAVKKAMKTKDSQPLPGGYGALTKRKRTSDANNAANLRAFGEACRKRNPHYKK